MLQFNAVPAGTMYILTSFANLPCLKGYYVVGRTSLALQIGHRLSIDLDFFSYQQKKFFRSKKCNYYRNQKTSLVNLY
jgi:hypothetical protein